MTYPTESSGIEPSQATGPLVMFHLSLTTPASSIVPMTRATNTDRPVTVAL